MSRGSGWEAGESTPKGKRKMLSFWRQSEGRNDCKQRGTKEKTEAQCVCVCVLAVGATGTEEQKGHFLSNEAGGPGVRAEGD